MQSNLNLASFIDAAAAVKDRTPESVLFHLVEEIGELSVNLNRPHKADEETSGELADVINCILDLHLQLHGEMMEIPALYPLEDDSKRLFQLLVKSVGRVAGSLVRSEYIKQYLRLALSYTLRIYFSEYSRDYTELQAKLDLKCAKWKRVALK